MSLHREDGFHVRGTIKDQELTLVVHLMLLELVEMLLQERWFAGINLSDRNQTIVEYGPQTRIHEDDELVQRDLLYQKPLTCLNTVHQFVYHGPYVSSEEIYQRSF